MSKIICDICGTSYAETAKQCPVCGCVRPGDVQRVTNAVSTDENGASGYTYVKGGRFSKSNVKKRTKTNNKAAAAPAEDKQDKQPRNNRGLVITAIVLLLAIIGVVIYIAVGFFDNIAGTDKDPSTPTATGSSQLDLSCRGITLDTDMVILSKAGDAHLLSYKLQPENTTDKVTFTSENPEIATVNEKGTITAVADGEVKITIRCGDAEKSCTVYCRFEQDPTATTAPTTPDATGATGTTDTTAPVDPTGTTTATTPSVPQNGTIRLNRKDITFSYKGESWELYSGDVAKNLITYSSDDEKVVTFADGKVVAVGGGMTTVYASYGDQKVSCVIRCSFKESTGVEGNGGVSEDGGSSGGVSEDGGASGNAGTPVNLTGKIVNVQVDVNVRSDAGTEYAKTGVLPLGQQITITETKNDSTGMKWYKTSAGWVREDFVQLDSN